MNYPLVSVVIPTHGRPQYLPRAVESVLKYHGPKVEVIVVPNGPDTSWREVVAQWADDVRVRIAPIDVANGNAARNYGLSLAKGKYIRFLDDDDYLLPSAQLQAESLESTSADISIGKIEVMTSGQKLIDVRPIPKDSDLVGFLLSPDHVTLPHAFLYRLSIVKDMRWDESITLAQDKHWAFKLCEKDDYTCSTVTESVGVWYQHSQARVSGDKGMNEQSKAWASMLIETAYFLKRSSRLNVARSQMASHRLWKHVFSCYFYDPPYWEEVIKLIQKKFPDWTPDRSLYRYDITGMMSTCFYLRVTAPLKHVKRAIDLVRVKLGLFHTAVKK